MDQESGNPQIDDGAAIHYSAVPPGTPVYASEGTRVGVVREVLDNSREHIFDGVVFRDEEGKARFADAPEVARTAERGVTLTLSAAEAAELGPPEADGAPSGPARSGGILGRLFGGRGR